MRFWQILGDALGLVEKDKRSPKVEPKRESIDFLNTKVSILMPVSFRDITRFVQALNKNQPLIVNFNNLNPTQAERSLDFVCGAVCALGGKLEKIDHGIYFYAPKGVKVENDKKYRGKTYAN